MVKSLPGPWNQPKQTIVIQSLLHDLVLLALVWVAHYYSLELWLALMLTGVAVFWSVMGFGLLSKEAEPGGGMAPVTLKGHLELIAVDIVMIGAVWLLAYDSPRSNWPAIAATSIVPIFWAVAFLKLARDPGDNGGSSKENGTP